MKSTVIIKNHSSSLTVPVAEIEVRPFEEPSMSLGTYSGKAPKGFSIEVLPQIKDPAAVVASVTMHKLEKSSEFILHIVNHTNKTISVAAWQLS